MTNVETIEKVREILHTASDDPADDLIRLGGALIRIGKTLKGKTAKEARAILRAVEAIQ